MFEKLISHATNLMLVNAFFQSAILKFIDVSFEKLPTVMQALRLLNTMERLNLKNLDIGVKYQRLLLQIGNSIEHIRKVQKYLIWVSRR